MTVVIDANILIAFGLADEPLYTQAQQILSDWKRTQEVLTAPRLYRSEITAVVRKAVYQQRLTAEQGRVLLAKLLVYQLTVRNSRIYQKEPYKPFKCVSDMIPEKT